MVEVNDTGKDTVIDQITASIDAKVKWLWENRWSATQLELKAVKDKIELLSVDREMLIDKKLAKTTHRLPSLSDPRPQTDAEVEDLMRLIDSV